MVWSGKQVERVSVIPSAGSQWHKKTEADTPQCDGTTIEEALTQLTERLARGAKR
ncbi:MAG: hypothetical protein JKY56_19025 [Kofleriaceae bacterium]|nr:hypothetical protein [Kofleriaceae bacterium]